VSAIQAQDTGGTLTLITSIPIEAQQLVIRRITPRTQTIDLHNGGRLTAELIEDMTNKVTMLIQEIDAQTITDDNMQDIRRDINTALVTAVDKLLQRIFEVDIKLAEQYRHLQTQLEEYIFLTKFLINFIESKHGPLGGAFPLITDNGDYLVTDNEDFLVTA